MAASNYSACLNKVFEYEGGYVNNPKDPGGATNFGITIAVARKYWKYDCSPQDLKAMPRSAAASIYRKQYWDKIAGDSLPEGIDLATFDASVNSGTGRADKWLAKALNTPLGSYASLAQIASNVPDKAGVVSKYCDIRLSFLQSLRTFSTFGKGWTRRVASVKALGIKMALQAAGKPAGEINKELGKEVAKHDKNLSKDVSTGSGGLATGGAATTTTTEWWAWDFTHIALAALVLLSILFIAQRIYTHIVAKEEIQKVIDEQVQGQ